MMKTFGPIKTRFRSLILTLCVAFATVESRIEAAPICDQQQNIVYREAHGVGLLMDVFTPSDKAKRNGLGIIQVVSGAWSSSRGKIRDLKAAQVFNIFCGKGYTVFAIRPGSLSKFSGIEMVENLEAGIVWVKQNANDFGVDPNRLGMLGASAGGHLASLAAVRNGKVPDKLKSTVQAVGVFFPPTDFIDYGGREIDINESDELSRMLKRLAISTSDERINRVLSNDDTTKALEMISPARLVTTETPPFLLIHGDADDAVPLQQSETMLKSLQAKGVLAKLIIKKGGGHPWLTIPLEVKIMADWFDEQLRRDE